MFILFSIVCSSVGDLDMSSRPGHTIKGEKKSLSFLDSLLGCDSTVCDSETSEQDACDQIIVSCGSTSCRWKAGLVKNT